MNNTSNRSYSENQSVAYPMIFTIRELVPSSRFVAGVTASGRALMVQEEDGAWWLYGVEPG